MNFDAFGDECPMGDECAIHFRQDEQILDDEVERGRIITYTGDWAVITDDTADPLAVMAFRLQSLGLDVKRQYDRYETSVTFVGEGSLGDLYEKDLDTVGEATRYIVSHDSWENFEEAHDMVVDAVMGGSIDLSRSAL